MEIYKELFKEILLLSKNHSKWDNGEFIGIKSVSNTNVGNVGQMFVERLCLFHDIHAEFPVNKKLTRANQSPCDLKINGVTFEIKTATEDTTGKFQFNHLRYHRDYNAVLCLGVSPNDLYFKIWSKAEVATNKAGKLVTMEKGANASYKLTKSKSDLYPISDFKDILCNFTDKFDK